MLSYDALEAALLSELDVSPDTPITGDLSPVTVAKIALSKSFLKKREDWPATMEQTQVQRALDLWIESNDSCANWSWVPDHVMDDYFVGELKKFLADLLDPQHEPDSGFSLTHIREFCEPGPGAARLTNSDNFYTKMFESKASATSEWVHTLYRSAISDTPWAEAEFIRHQRYGLGIVSGSQWFSVPKQKEIQRACATEPSINMLLQKALGTWVMSRLTRLTGVSLDSQPDYNRLLALRGSQTGLFGTVDLKSASDRISLSMVEMFFPPNFVKWVKAFRSPSCRLPDGSEVELAMCSSMGNGFTFPLQTALFVGVVATCYKLMGLPFRKLTKDTGAQTWAVFGDDIIVRREAFDYLCRQLNKLGHTVNDTKSFNNGPFRESCGCDYFLGYNVRGVYIRRLDSVPAVYSAINRLTRWSASHGVCLTSVLKLLLEQVQFLPVPFNEADTAGIKVPHDPGYIKLFRQERKTKQIAEDWQATPYRACISRTKRAVVTGCGDESLQVTNPGKGGKDCYGPAGNQAGWLVTALGGYFGTPPYIVDSKVTGWTLGDWPWPRSQKTRLGRQPVIGVKPKDSRDVRWKVKQRVTSSWDVIPRLPGPSIGEDRGEAWFAIAVNLEFLKLIPRA